MPSRQSDAVRRHWTVMRLADEQAEAGQPDDESWGDLTAEPREVDYSAASGVAFLAGSVLTSQAFNQAQGLVDYGGLLQRTTVTIGWAWLTLLAIYLLAGRSAASKRA